MQRERNINITDMIVHECVQVQLLTVRNSLGTLQVMDLRRPTRGWRELISFIQSTSISDTVPSNTS